MAPSRATEAGGAAWAGLAGQLGAECGLDSDEHYDHVVTRSAVAMRALEARVRLPGPPAHLAARA